MIILSCLKMTESVCPDRNPFTDLLVKKCTGPGIWSGPGLEPALCSPGPGPRLGPDPNAMDAIHFLSRKSVSPFPSAGDGATQTHQGP